MKALTTFLCLALLALGASATGTAPVPSPNQQQTQQQRQQQTPQALGGAAGGVSSDHWAVSLPGWGGSYGSELTVCNSGWGWGAWWGPNMECIDLIFRLRALQATPVPRPSGYLSIDPPADSLPQRRRAYSTLEAETYPRFGGYGVTACTPPAKAKSVAAAKKAGGCGAKP